MTGNPEIIARNAAIVHTPPAPTAPSSTSPGPLAFSLQPLALLHHPWFDADSVHSVFRLLAFSLQPLALLLLSACSSHPRPGHALTTPTPAGLVQSLSQPDNPSSISRQSQHTIHTRTYFVPYPGAASPPPPPGARASARSNSPIESSPSPRGLLPGNRNSKIENRKSLAPPVLITETTDSTAITELGPSHPDTSREFTAKLASLKSIVWIGLGLFLFGLASIFWAPLRAIIGSLTTSLAITLGGIALVVLPTLIVGHELLILAGISALVLAWFLAHRHGELRGQIKSKSQIETRNSKTANP